MSSGWIVFLAVMSAVLIGGTMIYHSIKRKMEEISLAAFGSKSLAEGLRSQADILAETPKSVSGMTRIFQPQIQRDFPDFHLEQFKNKVENLLVAVLEAVTTERIDLQEEVSLELITQVENCIAANRAAGIREVYSDIKVHRTEISDYRKKEGTCTIIFQSAVEYYHYREKDGQLVDGNRERKEQTKYNTELLYIQDEKLAKAGNAVGTTCPNCGAPITELGRMRCEYCGAAVTPINLKVWTFHQIYEVDYHHV